MSFLLSTQDLSVETVSGTPILKNINIDIAADAVTTLIGESGSGKTIFSRTLTALLPESMIMTGGAIVYNGETVDYKNLEHLRGNHIFYTPQNAAASLNPVIKIKRQINETSQLTNDEILELLEFLELNNPKRILNAYPFELSGGENRRCLLAMAVALQPKLLILDEPTTGLDSHLQENFMILLRKVRRQYGLAILLVSHNLTVVREVSDYIYIILNGKIIESGPPEHIFTAPVHDYTKELVSLFSNGSPRRGAFGDHHAARGPS